MKKLFSLITGFLLSLALISPVFANTVTVQAFSADSSVTHLENLRSVLVTVINGNIAGGSGGTSSVNILADSIGEIEMADDANPRVRDSELFNITTDSVSGGTLTQGAVVEDGLVPATDTDLTSDISAGTAYVNGYRVDKSATSQTYTASRDTYVDLSQTGVYTLTAVTLGAAQPAVAANSVRLAKVVTDGTQITSVTSLYTTRVPGLIIPSNYRQGMSISRDTTTTITVFPGSVELNNSIVTKTASSTLTISTAGDWAGGSSLRATSTMGFVGIDTSGNLKMHTTAPTHDNYAVTTTAGKKRYATWSSTVYRIIGWFFMNATGSGELDTWGVSNIKEGDVANSVVRTDGTADAINDTTYGSDLTGTTVQFYSSGGPVAIDFSLYANSSGGNQLRCIISDDVAGGTHLTNAERGITVGAAEPLFIQNSWQKTYPQRNNQILARAKVPSSSETINEKTMRITEN